VSMKGRPLMEAELMYRVRIENEVTSSVYDKQISVECVIFLYKSP